MKYSKDVNQYKNCKEAGAELERAIPFVARVKLKISEEEARKGLAEMARALFNEGTAMVVSGNKTAKFIAEMMELHQGIYDYSEVDYKDNKTKVKIICREHGPFWQTPNAHKNGRGCPSCARNQNLTTEQVIQQFRDVHGDRYIYDEVDYKGSTIKVKIICREHGAFWQTPTDHKRGKGCPECSKATRGRKQKETKAKKRAAKNKNAPVSGAV